MLIAANKIMTADLRNWWSDKGLFCLARGECYGDVQSHLSLSLSRLAVSRQSSCHTLSMTCFLWFPLAGCVMIRRSTYQKPHIHWTHVQCCGQTRPKLQSSVIWICYSSLSCGRGDCALGACCIQGSLLVPPLHNAKTSSSCLYGPHGSTVVFVCDFSWLYPPRWLGTCLQLPEACRKWHPPQSRAFRFNAFHIHLYSQRSFLLYPGASSSSLQALYLLRGRHPGGYW